MTQVFKMGLSLEYVLRSLFHYVVSTLLVMFPSPWILVRLYPVIFVFVFLKQLHFTVGTQTNIAAYAKLTVSSTLVYDNHDYNKENVVDGYSSSSSNFDTCGCCFCSAKESSPFLEAHFDGNFEVDRIVITGRDTTDGIACVTLSAIRCLIVQAMNNLVDLQLSGITVYLDNIHTSLHSSGSTITIRNVFPSHLHRIRISRRSWNSLYLAICELEVFSSGCVDGYYGNNCNETCGACIGGICDKSSGRCLHGCSAGFQGSLCKNCINGYFGNGCNRTCGLCAGGVCERSSGRCLHGCSTGFQGDLCDRCNDGLYGSSCNMTCGNCADGRCDMASGQCPHGCVAGYQGATCNTSCVDGTFGQRCAYRCHCKNQTICDKETGHCPAGCDTGWTGYNCTIACPSGTFGEYCTQPCHCLNDGNCDRFNGSCATGCSFGWTGLGCSTAIPVLFPVNASEAELIRPYENNVHVVNTSVPLMYLGKSYSQLYITKDGLVSFGKAEQFRRQNWSASDISPFINVPFVAPYYFQAKNLDILRDYTGAVSYRELNAHQIAQMNLSRYIRSEVVGSGNFNADWALQVTWSNVTSVDQIEKGPCEGIFSNPCPTNTFQLVLLSNGVDSYAIFNYGNMSMPPEKYDQAGFNGGHGKPWTNVLTSGESIDQLSQQQGSDVIGRYIFKISAQLIIRGGCSRNPNHDQLTIYPKYAGMFGGRMIDVSGPCFSKTDDIRCRFGTHQPGGQPPPETTAVYVSETRVRCMVPRLLVRDRILLSLTLDGSNYSYSAPLDIIFYGRMPDSEHVMAVSSTDPANNWLSKTPTALTMTWNGNLLSTDKHAVVDISLVGYKESNGKGEYKELGLLGTWVPVSDGSYTFHTAEHQCNRNDCFNYEIGVLVVTLQDRFTPNVYRYLSSKILPLGWWVHHAMRTVHGSNWPSTLCVDWYNKDKQDTAWLQSLLHCPCSLEQALADFGRWQPDLSCSIFNKEQNNCFYHKGAVHCVRAVQPIGKAGNQCCYDKDGDILFAADTFGGSTPDHSHDWGTAPYGKPGFVPGLSHWLTDVVTFYYCCLWNEYSACDFYMDSRPTRDCIGYTPPVTGSVYGQGHVTPFGGRAQNFRIAGPGDYTLLKAGNTIVQGRFERNLFPTEGGRTVSSVYSLTAVAVENVGHSDKVELRLRGPDTNNDHRKIDVMVNEEYLEFDEHALAWHDLKGVAVINTDRENRVQSNFTVILTNNIGLQVVEIANTLQLDVVVPPSTFSNVTGLFGDLYGTFRTPDGKEVDLRTFNTSSTNFNQKVVIPWRVHNRSSSLIHGFLSYRGLFDPVTFDPKPDPGCSSGVCNGNQECAFDLSHTCSEQIAMGTKKAMDRLAMMRHYLEPVRSCGLLDVPRAVKSSYGYTVGTTTNIQSCRVGTLSGPTAYTCMATSNKTQAWTPAVTTSCRTSTQPPIIG